MKSSISLYVKTVLLVLCIAMGCRKKQDEDDLNKICKYIPVYVDTLVNTSDINLLSLKTTGYAYLRSGYKGIILYKVSETEYKAFERASPYKMAEVGCLLKVDMQSFCIKDTCSGSKFDFSGNVIQEPANCPLLQYNTSFIDGNRIRIYEGLY